MPPERFTTLPNALEGAPSPAAPSVHLARPSIGAPRRLLGRAGGPLGPRASSIGAPSRLLRRAGGPLGARVSSPGPRGSLLSPGLSRLSRRLKA
jgi:hypothetical protein